MIVLSLSETREFPRATISNNMPTHCRLRAVLVVYCVLLVKSWDPIITSLWRVGKPSKPISVRPTLDGTRTQPNNTFLSLFAFAPSSYLLRLTVVSIFAKLSFDHVELRARRWNSRLCEIQISRLLVRRRPPEPTRFIRPPPSEMLGRVLLDSESRPPSTAR